MPPLSVDLQSMEIRCQEADMMPKVVEKILDYIGVDPQLVLLEGDLGAGKTTLTREFCRQLGCTDDATSPTFSLINVYNSRGKQVYHIDLYRLESLDEAFGIGIEDYIYSDNWCFVEWPALISPLLKAPYTSIEITTDADDTRILRILKITT